MSENAHDWESDPSTVKILRRETHASRAASAVLAAVLVGVLAIYCLFEAALKALGQQPWLLAPEEAWQWVRSLPGGLDPLLLGAAGGLVFLAGLFFFLSAVLPGRRSRHIIPNPRAAVVVENEVIASSLARRARVEAGVTPGQVVVTVSRRVVEVSVRPTSGIPVNEANIAEAVEDELRRTSVKPIPDVKVRLATEGVIGV